MPYDIESSFSRKSKFCSNLIMSVKIASTAIFLCIFLCMINYSFCNFCTSKYEEPKKKGFDSLKDILMIPFDAAKSVISLDALKVVDMVKPDNLEFILYKNGGNTTVSIKDIEKLIELPTFNKEHKLVIFVTGFGTDPEDKSSGLISAIRAYECRNDTNFVIYDTAGYLDMTVIPLYRQPAFNTQALGNYLAKALDKLSKVYPLEKVHLIGHSLGAQIVGKAGRDLKNMTNNAKEISRITGLDPAGPCFVDDGLTSISKNDGKFVMIIHSNPGFFGKTKRLGHADFYPDGDSQTGCGFFARKICAHSRSIKYFAESVYPNYENNFLAKNCSDSDIDDGIAKNCQGIEVPMGFATPSDTRGIYSLKIRKEETAVYANDYTLVNVTKLYGSNYTKPALCHGQLLHLGA